MMFEFLFPNEQRWFSLRLYNLARSFSLFVIITIRVLNFGPETVNIVSWKLSVQLYDTPSPFIKILISYWKRALNLHSFQRIVKSKNLSPDLD